MGGGTYVGYGTLAEAPYGTGMCTCAGYGTLDGAPAAAGAPAAGVDGISKIYKTR